MRKSDIYPKDLIHNPLTGETLSGVEVLSIVDTMSEIQDTQIIREFLAILVFADEA